MAEKEVDFSETVKSGELFERTLAIVCPVCGLEVTGGFSCCPNDGTKLIPDPASDSALSDKYDSLELIGEGGMSAIYKARHKLMKRTVAIKLLHSHFHSSPDLMRRFQKEAEAVSSMSHENVVNVFDFGQLQHGQPYMVMNYVPGKSLSRIIKEEGQLELQRCLSLFAQIARGLEHAHKKHIVHRDLKPTNVMLAVDDNGQERAVIVDFGIAKFMAEGEKTVADLTKTGAVIGSPYYMSPEQCLGQEIDFASDIYSLGCLMYEALSGKPMFAGNSSLETMHKHCNEKPPVLQTLNGNPVYRPHMQAIIHHAVEKRPRDRYQSASDLLQDIVLLEDAVQRGNVPKLSALRACSERRLKTIPLIAVCACALLCGGQMYFWWTHPVEKPQNKPSVLPNQAHHRRNSPAASDDAGLHDFISKNPTVSELSATGISGKGLSDLVRLANLEKLELQGCTADDPAFAALAGLKNLKELNLKDCARLGNKGLFALGKITSLKRLVVEGNRLTDEGFAGLTGLKSLEELAVLKLHKLDGPGIRSLAGLPHLSSLCISSDSEEIHDDALKIISETLPDLVTLKLESTQLSDGALNRYLPRFHRLQRLSISFSHAVTDKGMKAIAQSGLKWLNINGTEVTDEGVKTIANMKQLEQIFFWHTRITDGGMQYLQKVKSLQVLHLSSTSVTDAGLSKLAGLENLKDLKLKETKVTADGLKVLKDFKKLERLSLEKLPVTDEGLKALCDVPALAELDLSATLITEAGVKQLVGKTSLRQLYLKDCRSINPACVDALKKIMPFCRIHSAHVMPSRAIE